MKLNNIKGGKHKRGRPPTKPVVFKDGFYFEVRNRATDPGSGIKIGKPTYAEMMVAIEEYRKIKLVVVLGEYKNGERISQLVPKKKKKAA
jgi:hypothetical protein